MTETLELIKITNEKLSISTRADLNLSELGSFFIGLDNLYRIIYFFECFEVDSQYLKMFESVKKEINKIEKNILKSKYSNYDMIVEQISEFLVKEYDYQISFEDERKIITLYKRKNINPLNISSNLNSFLLLPFKKYFSSKGLGFKKDIWNNLNQTQVSKIRELLQNHKYFKIDQQGIKSVTDILYGELEIKRINYNSPGSIDLLGLGKILEVIKDFILEIKKGKDNKSKSNLEEVLLMEKINEQRISNTSKSLENIDKLIGLKEKSLHLDDRNLKALIEFVDVNGVSLNEMSKKITSIEIKAENEE